MESDGERIARCVFLNTKSPQRHLFGGETRIFATKNSREENNKRGTGR